MKIGVLGAPGAGKSKFAKGLARSIGSRQQTAKVQIVDGYVQKLQKASGLALGPWGSYAENLMIAGVREADRAKRPDCEHQITVGTIMDTMVYTMVHTDIVFHNDPVARRQQSYDQSTKVIGGLNLWYTQTWDYDLCFYLPLKDGLQFSSSAEDQFRLSLDQAYMTVLETFYVPNVFGIMGDAKERVSIANEVIGEFGRAEDEAREAIELADPQELSVRPGSEDGEGRGDSPGSVSDVPLSEYRD